MDSWCKPVIAKSGNIVSGGAARLVRTAAAGGMDEIVKRVAMSAAREALALADAAAVRKARPRLRVVANG